MTDAIDRSGSDARSPSEIPGRGWRQVLGRVITTLRRDHVSLLGAGIAFKGMLALFPALIAAVSIWGLVADPQTVTQQLGQLVDGLPEQAQQVIETQLTEVAAASTGALSWAVAGSIAVALWSASAGMLGLVEGTNVAYDEVDERSFIHRRALALAFTLGGLVFVLVSLAILVLVPVLLGEVGLGREADVTIRILQWPVLAVMVMVVLALVYRYGPDREDAQLRWVTPGAVLASVLWLLASAAFTLYVEIAGDFAATYGALAGVVVLMLWLYLTAVGVLIGAEFNGEAERQTAEDTTTGAAEPMGQRGAVVADTRPER